VFAVPRLQLMLVRQGSQLASAPADFRARLAQYLFQPVIDAVLE
jgi:hypothetical protein